MGKDWDLLIWGGDTWEDPNEAEDLEPSDSPQPSRVHFHPHSLQYCPYNPDLKELIFFHDIHSLWHLKPLVTSWWNYLGKLRWCGLTRSMLWQGQGAGFEVSKLTLFLVWNLRYKFSAFPATMAAVMSERES